MFAFVSSDWQPHLEDFLEIVQIHGRSPLVIGGSADGLIGVGEEDENVSGFSLLFLNLPNTEVRCCEIGQAEVEQAGGEGYWSEVTGVGPGRCCRMDPVAEPDRDRRRGLVEELEL